MNDQLRCCPTCRQRRPANRPGAEPWCCSIDCYLRYWNDNSNPNTTDPRRPPPTNN